MATLGFQGEEESQEYHGASTEVYGFVAWMSTFVLFGMYLVWAFLPDAVLHDWGITYYPDRYWAVAGPTWITATFFWVVCMNVCLNMVLGSADEDSAEAVTDSHAIAERLDGCDDAVFHIYDLPLLHVNHVLYPGPQPGSLLSSSHS